MINRAMKASVSCLAIFALTACGTPVADNIGRDFDRLTSELGNVSLFEDGYVSDASDRCISQRRAMAEEGSFFDTEILRSALLGAAGGAATAALTGQSVGKGALIGAGLGLAAGYLNKLQSEGLSGTQIASRVGGEVADENRRIDRLINAFDDISACRKAEAAAIQSAFNAKTINRETAEEQMAGVRTKFAEDRAKFKEIALKIDEKSKNNAAIYNDIAADSGGNELEVREYNRGKKSTKVNKRRPKKSAGTEEGSLQANKSEVNSLQRECLTNVQKRDDCFDKVAEAEEVEGDLDLDLG